MKIKECTNMNCQLHKIIKNKIDIDLIDNIIKIKNLVYIYNVIPQFLYCKKINKIMKIKQ